MAYKNEDMTQEQLDEMVKEFLTTGGEVTQCEKYARSEDIEYTHGWGKKRKKAPAAIKNS